MDFQDDVFLCICLNLRRGARRVTQRYDDVLRPARLKVTQFTLLAALDKLGRTTVQPLAELMAMDRTTLTRNLAVLEKRGWVEVQRGTADRREHWIRVLPLGKSALKRAQPLWQEAQKQALAMLGSAGAERLVRLTQSLAEIIAAPEN